MFKQNCRCKFLIYSGIVFLSVPGAGIEPALCCQNWILNPARLPIPPPGLFANWFAKLKIKPELPKLLLKLFYTLVLPIELNTL